MKALNEVKDTVDVNREEIREICNFALSNFFIILLIVFITFTGFFNGFRNQAFLI